LIRLFTTVVVLFFSIVLHAQDKTALENKRKKLESEINYTQNLLKKTQATKDASLNDLVTLDKQISLRKELITNTEKEVQLYSAQISETSKQLNELERNLKNLRDNYATAIYGTYRHFRATDQLLFIASASSFSDGFRKINYLRKVGEYRKRQLDDIIRTQRDISRKLSEVQQKKNAQESLLTKQKRQESALNKNKIQKSKLIEDLKKKESSLSQQLANKRKEAEKLNSQIQAIIAKEIAMAKKKAEDERAKTGEPATPGALAMTPEVAKLSANFVSNKGRLPWPVERGVISKYFGSYKHEELGITMENNGIDIRTESYANVRVVFDGTVVGVVSNPIYKTAVIVSHGDYFTVYSKLDGVSVKKGDKVNAKQVIGKVFTDQETNESEMHFEVWQGSNKLNPTQWIAR
jgi:murein hydrolase activator